VPKQKVKIKPRLQELARRYRPREKAAWQGIAALRDHELLALIIGSGQANYNVLEISKKVESVLARAKTQIAKSELLKIFGIGEAAALRILASLEFGRRLATTHTLDRLDSPAKIYALTRDLQGKKQEHCLAFYLNGRQELLSRRTISIGGLNYNYLEPREIFAEAFVQAASGLILVHNHPSGDPQPSDDDLLFTEKLARIADLLGIKLLDHLVVGRGRYFSMRENFSELLSV